MTLDTRMVIGFRKGERRGEERGQRDGRATSIATDYFVYIQLISLALIKRRARSTFYHPACRGQRLARWKRDASVKKREREREREKGGKNERTKETVVDRRRLLINTATTTRGRISHCSIFPARITQATLIATERKKEFLSRASRSCVYLPPLLPVFLFFLSFSLLPRCFSGTFVVLHFVITGCLVQLCLKTS